MKATCSGCPASWTGLNIAHCGASHETFSTVRHFDSHRLLGHCADPAGLKYGKGSQHAGQPLLRRDSRGIWVGAIERPEVNAA